MNAIMILAGVALILAGGIRSAIKYYSEAPPSARHGDRRIVNDAGEIWTQQYSAFPGWTLRDRFDTLEEAKENKSDWDAIQNRVNEDRELKVIVE